MPIGVWLLTRPVALLVPLGLAIPDVRSLAGEGGGFEVSISDLLLVLVGAGILLEAATTKSFPALRALRPVFVPVLQYSVVIGLLLFAHLGSGSFAQTGQRLSSSCSRSSSVPTPRLRGGTSVCSRRTSST